VSITWQKQRVWLPSPWISIVRDDHAVLAALARADGVEQADDHAVEAALLVVGECQELVHRLGVGVGPATRRGGAVDAARVLGERELLTVVAVHLAGGGDEHALAEAVAVLQHDLGALHVRDERAHRLLDDQPDADRSRQVVHDVALVDELVDHRRREHGVHHEVEARMLLEVLDVADRAGRQVVEDPYLPALREQQLREMRADEARPARDQCLLAPVAHRVRAYPLRRTARSGRRGPDFTWSERRR
jgi:hypothetical protein